LQVDKSAEDECGADNEGDLPPSKQMGINLFFYGDAM
jgi:hypothetical protein